MNLKLIYFDLKSILYSHSDVAACGALDRAINRNHRSSIKAGGMWRNLIRWRIVFKRFNLSHQCEQL